MVTMKTKGPNGHDGNQREKWSRWKPKGPMVTMETKGPSGHDGNQRAQWSRWKPKGTMVTMETKGPNSHDGNQRAQWSRWTHVFNKLSTQKLSFFHGLFLLGFHHCFQARGWIKTCCKSMLLFYIPSHIPTTRYRPCNWSLLHPPKVGNI